MEESNGNQVKKKLSIKMGGGGIGAVVLLGGALATAALVSALVVRKNGRSSGKDRRRHRHRSPPEINKEKGKDEADKPEQFVSLDQPSHVNKYPSSGATKEVESDNDTAFRVSSQSSTMDVAEEISDAISHGSEKIHEDELTIKLTKEDEIPIESQNLEQVHIEEESSESEPIDDGENQPKQEESNEVCYDQEEIKVILVDTADEEVHIDQKEAEKNVNMEVDMENGGLEEGQKSLLPVLDSHVMEHENVNTDIMEIIKENEFIEGDDQPDEIIVVEQCDEPIVVKEENARIVYPIVVEQCDEPIVVKEENVEVTKDRENDLERDIEKEVEELELIFLENIENGTSLSDEVGGKIQEDKVDKKGEHDSFFEHQEKPVSTTFPKVVDSSRFSDEKGNYSEKTFINKYVAGLAMLSHDYLTNSTSWRIIIATLSVMSYLSCSWFFGLSFLKLCLVVFFTMVLSSLQWRNQD